MWQKREYLYSSYPSSTTQRIFRQLVLFFKILYPKHIYNADMNIFEQFLNYVAHLEEEMGQNIVCKLKLDPSPASYNHFVGVEHFYAPRI